MAFPSIRGSLNRLATPSANKGKVMKACDAEKPSKIALFAAVRGLSLGFILNFYHNLMKRIGFNQFLMHR
jgi:hypothetical protein